MANLIIALQIAGVGMSLVFGAILLLWLVMSILVRLAAGQPAAPAVDEASTEMEIRRRAAAAAVAVALASQAPAPSGFAVSRPASVSVWQTVMRGRGLQQPSPRR